MATKPTQTSTLMSAAAPVLLLLFGSNSRRGWKSLSVTDVASGVEWNTTSRSLAKASLSSITRLGEAVSAGTALTETSLTPHTEPFSVLPPLDDISFASVKLALATVVPGNSVRTLSPTAKPSFRQPVTEERPRGEQLSACSLPLGICLPAACHSEFVLSHDGKTRIKPPQCKLSQCPNGPANSHKICNAAKKGSWDPGRVSAETEDIAPEDVRLERLPAVLTCACVDTAKSRQAHSLDTFLSSTINSYENGHRHRHPGKPNSRQPATRRQPHGSSIHGRALDSDELVRDLGWRVDWADPDPHSRRSATRQCAARADWTSRLDRTMFSHSSLLQDADTVMRNKLLRDQPAVRRLFLISVMSTAFVAYGFALGVTILYATTSAGKTDVTLSPSLLAHYHVVDICEGIWLWLSAGGMLIVSVSCLSGSQSTCFTVDVTVTVALYLVVKDKMVGFNASTDTMISQLIRLSVETASYTSGTAVLGALMAVVFPVNSLSTAVSLQNRSQSTSWTKVAQLFRRTFFTPSHFLYLAYV
ncbi:hypothetical protein P7C70_g2008, partial [Phenoliferia sp. Uapishka_3]